MNRVLHAHFTFANGTSGKTYALFAVVMSRFESEQQRLRDGVDKGEAKLVSLDPDGSSPLWIRVVIEGHTGVVCATQCAGTNTDLRLVEGYLIPLCDCESHRCASCFDLELLAGGGSRWR